MEPGDLVGGHGVVQADGVGGVVGVVDGAEDGLVGGEVCEVCEADAVVLTDAVVVGGVLEGEWEQALLLEVGLVDAGEAAGYDGGASEEPGGEGGVLAAASLAVVVVADYDPADPGVPVVLGGLGEGAACLAGEDISSFAGLAGEGVGRAHEHVLAELGEVAAVLEPRPCGGYVVGGGLALRLHKDWQADVVAAVPGRARGAGARGGRWRGRWRSRLRRRPGAGRRSGTRRGRIRWRGPRGPDWAG